MVPSGTCIFSDFDLLNTFELDAACLAARAAEAAGATVLNHPERALERVALLRKLKQAGLGPIEVWRLEEEQIPTSWPIFIRCEDGAVGADTGLLSGPKEFEAALLELRKDGKSLKRRVAVGFAAKPDEQGFFRKYGAFLIGGRVIPQHILRNRHWMVKSAIAETDDAFVDEELSFVKDNPHKEQLTRIASHVGIDFARIDYGLIDGAVVVYEMNTNPTFPRFSGGAPGREARRKIIANQLEEAFLQIAQASPPASFSRSGGRSISLMIERSQWYQDLPHSIADLNSWKRRIRRLSKRKN